MGCSAFDLTRLATETLTSAASSTARFEPASDGGSGMHAPGSRPPGPKRRNFRTPLTTAEQSCQIVRPAIGAIEIAVLDIVVRVQYGLLRMLLELIGLEMAGLQMMW
jgi:hypothetical protein